MRVKILTLKYSDRLDGFDTSESDDFVKDKDLLEIRDHFFLAGGSPRLTIILTYHSADYPKEPLNKKQAEVPDKRSQGKGNLCCAVPG